MVDMLRDILLGGMAGGKADIAVCGSCRKIHPLEVECLLPRAVQYLPVKKIPEFLTAGGARTQAMRSQGGVLPGPPTAVLLEIISRKELGGA